MRLETRDIYYVAFLDIEKGIVFENLEKDPSTGNGVFVYQMDQEAWGQYKSEFYKSSILKCKYSIQKIKDLLR